MNKIATWLARILLYSVLMLAPPLLAAAGSDNGGSSEQFDAYRRIGLGAAAAFAVAISIVGAGYAVGKIGSAALGAAVEKPELLIRSLLFIALAEGLAVLGFAVAMMILQKM